MYNMDHEAKIFTPFDNQGSHIGKLLVSKWCNMDRKTKIFTSRGTLNIFSDHQGSFLVLVEINHPFIVHFSFGDAAVFFVRFSA